MPLKFGEKPIRHTIINGDVWFVAKDIVEVLDSTWNSNRLNILPDEWFKKEKIFFLRKGGRRTAQLMYVINEQAVYSFINRSNHPEAIELANTVAAFMKKARLGEVDEQDVTNLGEAVQLTLFRLTGVKAQRKANHKYNRLPKTRKDRKGLKCANARKWNERYELLLDMGYRKAMEVLQGINGVPESICQYSGQDALRWDKETYGYAMAFADMSELESIGIDENRAQSTIAECIPMYLKVGQLYGEKNSLRQRYKGRQKPPNEEAEARQLRIPFHDSETTEAIEPHKANRGRKP